MPHSHYRPNTVAKGPHRDAGKSPIDESSGDGRDVCINRSFLYMDGELDNYKLKISGEAIAISPFPEPYKDVNHFYHGNSEPDIQDYVEIATIWGLPTISLAGIAKADILNVCLPYDDTIDARFNDCVSGFSHSDDLGAVKFTRHLEFDLFEFACGESEISPTCSTISGTVDFGSDSIHVKYLNCEPS